MPKLSKEERFENRNVRREDAVRHMSAQIKLLETFIFDKEATQNDKNELRSRITFLSQVRDQTLINLNTDRQTPPSSVRKANAALTNVDAIIEHELEIDASFQSIPEASDDFNPADMPFLSA